MFGRLSKQTQEAPSAPAGPLDRIGRRTSGEGRAETAAAPADRAARVASAAAALSEVVEPRLRAMVKAGAPAGEITRQAGQLAQAHFRGNGVLLAPLELRGYVADVLRPVLPATSFSAPAATEAEAPEPVAVPAEAHRAVTTPDLSERSAQASRLASTKPVEMAAKSDTADKSASRLSRSKVDQARRAVQPRRHDAHRSRRRRQPAAQGAGAPARGPGRRAPGRAPPAAQPAGTGRSRLPDRQRHDGAGPARAAARGRGHHRHHDQRAQADLRRARTASST